MDFLASILPSIIGAGASLFGASSSAKSISQTNQSNKDNAQAQMDFQERMSDTAHQREVKDLEAAGLNPILSANAGASTPGGAMATFKDASAPITAATQGVASSAESILPNMQAKANIANTNANTAKIIAETTIPQLKSDLITQLRQAFTNSAKNSYPNSHPSLSIANNAQSAYATGGMSFTG